MRRRWTVVPLLVTLAQVALAQSPPRPTLAAGADTNDADVYLAWGKSKLQKSPKDAAAAFYWASRIEPGRAGGYYARWVALQLADPSRFTSHYERKKSTLASPQVQASDSIQLRALELGPLDYRDLDGMLVGIVYRGGDGTYSTRERLGTVVSGSDATPGSGSDSVRLPGATMPSAGTGAVYRMSAPASGGSHSLGGAWSEYAHGNFPQALNGFAAVLSGAKAKWAIYAERGRVFAITKSPDSAVAQLALSISSLPKDSAHELTYVYESVALYEHTRGLVFETQKLSDSARAAYQRALDADPSYVPAQLRIAALDLAKGDTAAAISHYDLAAQIRPSDGLLACQYGLLLIKSGHDPEALEQLERAAKLEPYFAAPRFLAAAVYDAHDMKPQALAGYTAFLSVASKSDPLVSRAKERLAALQ